MKAALVLVSAAAALVGSAAAHAELQHRHAHPERRFVSSALEQDEATCVPGCTTIWNTYYGEATLHHPPAPSTSSVPVSPPETTTILVVPTPQAVTCPTPGTYTFPAQTVTLTETTTVCAAATTTLPSGTHTIGGVTTIVETSTTVICPVATVQTQAGLVTSTIVDTTYVCPTPGTYTIGATTTTVTVDLTVVVYQEVATYCPGTYTAPDVVTTVTDTDYVFYCPFTSGAWSTSTAGPAATLVATEAVATPASPPPPPPPSPPAPGSSDTNHWAVTYTPFNSDKSASCKTADQVMADVQSLAQSQFRAVRIYSTDCDALDTVGAACEKYGLKLIIGVFIKQDGCSYSAPTVKTQVDAIALWARWDLVELFVVGNEAILDGHCTAVELAALVVDTKARTGYPGPFSCTEPTNIWQEPATVAALCPVIDFVGGNLHAYFNPETTPPNAGAFVLGQLQILDAVCPGKTAVNLESGWPKQGACIGVACPSPQNQAVAIASIVKYCGHRTAFFSFADDMWKYPGDCGCEPWFGCADLFTDPAFYSGL